MRDVFAEKFVEALRPLLPSGSRVGVAVSGGADSVVLLELLRRHAEEFGASLTVLHVNHGLRGAESESDEQFVGSIALSLGLPFVNIRLEAKVDGNLEQEARRRRREFFLSQDFDRVALGHSRSDQAETVLHRFLRGSGTTGLGAMRALTPEGIIRPLLGFGRDEIREWARVQNLLWREDSSNSDPRFTRNRLRREVLPVLAREFNPNLEAVLAGTAQLAQAECDYLESEVDRIYGRHVADNHLGLSLHVREIQDLPLALRRRLLRRALSKIRATGLRGLDFDHIESVLGLCHSVEGHDRVLVPGADALRSFDQLLLMRPNRYADEPRGYRFDVSGGGTYLLPGGAGEICLDLLYPESSVCDTFKKECSVEEVFLAEKAVGQSSLLLRNWEPGDELWRPGRTNPEKIKDLFQQFRVSLWRRRHWPVLVSGGRILWAGRFGPAIDVQSPGDCGAMRLTWADLKRKP